MTVQELITALQALPPDMPVVVDHSRDYADHRKCRGIQLGNFNRGHCGGEWSMSGTKNAVRLV